METAMRANKMLMRGRGEESKLMDFNISHQGMHSCTLDWRGHNSFANSACNKQRLQIVRLAVLLLRGN